MDFRERLLAQPVLLEGEGDRRARAGLVDVGSFVRRLILFEHYMMDSGRLTEFPALVDVFGRDGLRDLLESGVLSVRLDPALIAYLGDQSPERGHLPAGWHSFAQVEIDPSSDYVGECLSELTHELGSSKSTQKLKRAIVDHLVERPPGMLDSAHAQLVNDLKRVGPHVVEAVAISLSRKVGSPVRPADFMLAVERQDDYHFRAESDIAERFRLTEQEAQEVIGRGLTGVAGLSVRLAEMKAHEVVTAFRDEDLPVFDAKLQFLATQIDPDAQESRLTRVIELAGLPDIETASRQRIDVEALLDLRGDPDWQQFRQWLRQTDSSPDEEVEAQLRSASERIARIVHGRPGKTVRFAVTTAASLIPGLALPAEVALGAVDEFLVDKVVRRPGPASFVSRLYKSVFET